MKKNLSLLWALLCLNVLPSFSQEEIPVDMYTGTPTIHIPLWTVSQHDIGLPVALSYNANGIRAGQARGNFGLGWNLIAGGSVKRQVKGLPDDFAGKDTDHRRGWLYNRVGGAGVAAEVGAFGNTADLNPITCSDELADHATLSAWNDLIDTEPDIFSFSFPGYSGSFVFDNGATPSIHLMPYQDVDIRYERAPSHDNQIISFTIKTNDGTVYTFARTVEASKVAPKSNEVQSFSFLAREWAQYNSVVEYYDEWKLTRIDSPTGAYLALSYLPMEETKTSKPVNLAFHGVNFSALAAPGASILPHTVFEVYTINETHGEHWLDEITGSGGQKVKFIRKGDLLETVEISDTRREPDPLVKQYLLGYDGPLLKTITEYSECDKKPPYIFDYLGSGNTNDGGVVDYWGFRTGRSNKHVFSQPYFVIEGDLMPKIYVYPDEPLTERFRLYPIPGYQGTEFIIEGTDRRPDPSGMKANILNKITYPALGSVVLQYQAHTYYDQRAGISQYAGGLRIKSITQHDGMTKTGYTTKEFFYDDPSTGQSSGKLISTPQFVLPAWKYRDVNAINDATKDKYYADFAQTETTEEVWKFLTIRSETDLSEQALTHGSTVGYRFVKVKRSGAGSALFEFHVPGTVGETSNGQWTATQNKFARPAGWCPDMPFITGGGVGGYPFTTNPEIDHERGLVWKKSEFNESGVLVRFTETGYDYLYKANGAAHNVSCVQYEYYPNAEQDVYFYGKYFLPTDYARVVSNETVTTYDPTDNTRKSTESMAYFFESPNHKLLSMTKRTTGDGTEYTTRMKYVPDFTNIPANSEPALLRIKDLQDPVKFRHGTLVEQWHSVKRPGGVEKVTGASLITFNDFSRPGKVFVESTRSLAVAAPVTDFQQTKVQLEGATHKLIPDDRYEITNTITAYDDFSLPLSQTGTDRVASTTMFGFNKTLPVATVTNANFSQVAFSDFETITSSSFSVSTPNYQAVPRTGLHGMHPYSTLTKTVTRQEASEFVLSFWIKATAPLDYRVRIYDGGTEYFNSVFSHEPSSGDFEQVRHTIPVAAAPSMSTFVVEVKGESVAQPSGSSGTLLPSIDDIAFIPQDAELVSNTYNIPYGIASTTNALGKTAYRDYDKLGRPTLTYDHEKNILSRSSVHYITDVHKLEAYISTNLRFTGERFPEITAYRNEPASFTALQNPCIDNVTYEWIPDYQGVDNFVPGTAQLVHTFTENGMYNVKLRVSAPNKITQTATMKVKVVPRAIPIEICSSGTRTYICGGEDYRSNNCPPTSSAPPPPPGGTLFYATLGETLPGVTYSWKKRYLGTETWVDEGTNSNQFIVEGLGPHDRGFHMKCEVTHPDGRKGESNTLRIDVYPCE